MTSIEGSMTMDALELLGPAEKHIAEEMRAAVELAKTDAQKLLNALEEIDLDLVDGAMLDADRRATVIALVPSLQSLAKHLGDAALVPLLAKVMIEPKKATV